jgi:site-specific recombinase XerD
MDGLLEAPNCDTFQGRRDRAVLLYLYNSGARADEVARTQIGDLDLGRSAGGLPVLVRGKGGKLRRCPLLGKNRYGSAAIDRVRRSNRPRFPQ